MMKNLTIFTCALAACSLSSCQMLDGEDSKTAQYGALQLQVTKQEPAQTRASSNVSVDVFNVNIKSASNDQHWDYVVATMPSTITLPYGDYTVTAGSPMTFARKMDAPYFSGQTSMTIKEGMTTHAEVNCRQQNSRIEVRYGEAFLAAYSEWTITIDDGSNSVLLFDNTPETQQPVYWTFNEGTKTLRANLTATPAGNGNKVKGSLTLTKADAVERYDDDNECYSGGDAICINIGLGNIDEPTSTTGTASISVNVNAVFNNETEEVEIPVVWDTDKDEADDKGNVDIIFSQNDVTYSMSAHNAPEHLDAVLSTPRGMTSTKVKIDTDCAAFKAALADLAESNLYLLEGHELVGDEILPFVISSLGLGDIPMPAMGDKTYTFPIATFYPFIEMYMDETDSAYFNFLITVTDAEGEVKESTLKLTITK